MSHTAFSTPLTSPFPFPRLRKFPGTPSFHQHPIAPWTAPFAPFVHCIYTAKATHSSPLLAVSMLFVPCLCWSPFVSLAFPLLRISWRWFAIRWAPPSLSMLCLCALCTAWFGFFCVSDFYFPYPPASTQQGISLSTLGPSTITFIPLLCWSPSEPGSPILFARKFRDRQVLCPASSLWNFHHRRNSLPGPAWVPWHVSVFSDGIELSRPHVTERLRTILASAGFDGNFLSKILSDRFSHFWERNRRFPSQYSEL